ncbi:MFS transporter [Pseudonocardia halophobica]|uniref:MFS transporter n=1 Tax=Pseudonocardia halophobica TaxID=29401 RepID=UPI003D8B9710
MTKALSDTSRTLDGDPRPVARWPLLTSLWASLVVINMNTIVPVTLLPGIGTDLQASGALLNWTVIITVVLGAVATALAPRIAERTGERTLVILLLGGLVVGSVIAAVAPNMLIHLIGRAIAAPSLGIGSLAMSIVRNHVNGAQLSRALRAIPVGEFGGGMIGLLLGGLITELLHVDWRVVFGVMAALALACILSAIPSVPNERIDTRHRIDWFGASLLTAAITLLLIPLSAGSTWGWGSATTLILFALGIVAVVAWVRVSRGQKDPFADPAALANPNFARTWVVYLLSAASVWIMNFTVPSIAGAPTSSGFGFGFDPLMAGLVIIPLFVIATVGCAISMQLRWERPQVVARAGFSVILLAFVGLALFHDQAWQLWMWPAIFGIGWSVTLGSSYILLMQSLPLHKSATAAGIGHLAGAAGTGLGAAGVTAVLTANVLVLDGGAALPTEGSFTAAWWVGAGISVIAVLCTVGVKLRKSQDADEAAAH